MDETLQQIRKTEIHFSRRRILGAFASAALGATLPFKVANATTGLKGRINQSVCLWCYDRYLAEAKMDLDGFAATCQAMGIKSIELTRPGQWPTLKRYGLICAMTPSHSIAKGLNRLENHDECLKKVRQSIDDSFAAGFPNVITFSGNREGMDEEEGLKNCVIGLKKIAGYAEQKKVTVCLEFLNSIDHKDYMADSTRWCVELVRRVGSTRVKVLYDIYHAAMMKEEVLSDIQDHHSCWGHYHTGGYPGRNEIDQSQALDYPALMRAIAASGFSGFVGQEFVPRREDALKSLQQAVHLCDV